MYSGWENVLGKEKGGRVLTGGAGEADEGVKLWLGYHIQEAGEIAHFGYTDQGEKVGKNRKIKSTAIQFFLSKLSEICFSILGVIPF